MWLLLHTLGAIAALLVGTAGTVIELDSYRMVRVNHNT